MISPSPPAPESRSLSREDRWRQAWLVVLAVTLVLLTVAAVAKPFGEPGPPGNAASAASPATAGPGPIAAAVPSPSSLVVDELSGPPASLSQSPAAPIPLVATPPLSSSPAEAEAPQAAPAVPPASFFPPAGVLRLDGTVPVKGSGEFEFANERGPIAGARGTVRRFKVAVEKGSGEDVAGFAAQVWAVLSDERSWIGDGTFRLQMVTGADPADFTVYLATRETAGRMCELGGTNIRIGGVPYTSCRTVGKAIINLDRWRGSAQPYVAAEIGLTAYRQYVINHEVGHEFGHRHEGCPQTGGPAPVMVQQTLTLRGCVPYSWPRRDGRSLSGPSL